MADDPPEEKILVRGADGSLYALSPEQLAPAKLSEEKSEAVTEILENAHINLLGAAPLPNDVVRSLIDAGTGVKTSVFTNIPPETSP